MGKDEGGKGGVVVNISSVLGLFPMEGSPIYVATKHAVIGLTRSFGVSTVYSIVGILYWGRVAFCLLCSFYWVKPRRLNLMCRRFGILDLFHLHWSCADTRPMKMGRLSLLRGSLQIAYAASLYLTYTQLVMYITQNSNWVVQ